jgi:hypothetical protein
VTDELIAYLNTLLDLDREALSRLVEFRTPANSLLWNHTSVQVVMRDVGLLGILNGFCGTVDGGPKAGWGPITAVFGDDGNIRKFCRTGG